ncbi:50S ribosomal protein L32 [Candidatus Synchoanobacter obligatus]|uniref:Large ribosomal subunit protein bL32 n=1 Tax=Candidatus Synchoanobacter obligatus TaxID=2919597 RepID=A0ABT1L3H5_9GAMM|nr:50S ribosomal protein L32 [Candidatus Synchoanobacter obligatus]MCP8351770.1 50S ribosomal protein L32 [Candidatus Synchoanobacter obligatus]
MAVQKSRKSKSKAKSRRTKKLAFANVISDPVTGEKVLRHHVSPEGFYKGKSVLASANSDE